MQAPKKIGPFDFVNSVSSNKRDILTTETEKEYLPFIINKTLSYHIDCVLAANLMNQYRDLPKRAQYSFYLNSLIPRKRFAKWVKTENDETISALQAAFNVSEKDARIALNLLSKKQIEKLLETKDIGGVTK